MFKNYLNTTIRNLTKNKLYSLINISGLAIGMAACFFIFQYVRFEMSYDKFNTKIDRLYRVPITYERIGRPVTSTATNHPAVGPAMKADFPEVEDFVRVAPKTILLKNASLAYTQPDGKVNTFNENNFYFTDGSFFNLFSFPFISGNPANSLTKANSIVITKSIAQKYFGRENAMNGILKMNGIPLTVTGVIEDIPENSHFKFDFLISLTTGDENFAYGEWGWPEFYNYVLLKEGADPEAVQAKLPAFVSKYLGKGMAELKVKYSFTLQPVADIHLKSNLGIELESNGSERTVYFLSVLGVLILVIAWINYINLSTARSLERAKEVGLKKVIGATKKQLVTQFMFESMVVNSFALLLATIIVITTSQWFDGFIGKKVSESFFASGLATTWMFWLSILFVFVIGTVQVGAYPAFVLSAFRPVLVLKGKFSQSAKGVRIRGALVALQFSLSIVLIAGSIIVYRQLTFMQTTDTGYNKEQLMVVRAPAIKDSTFQSQVKVFNTTLKKDPAILGVAPSSEIPGKTIFARNDVRKFGDDSKRGIVSALMEIDDNFLPTYNVQLAAGSNIPVNDPVNMFESRNTRVLINEQMVKDLGYKDNQSAIGRYILLTSWFGDIKGEVVGVVKNYHQRSLKEQYQRILYYYNNQSNWEYFSISIAARQHKQALSFIEQTYQNIFPGNAFESFFLDDYFNRQYAADQRFGRIFTLFTILAIIIACIGLVGLSTFAIRLRTKEIGIRKVLGASTSRIIYIFYKDFISLIALAAVISIPVVYLAAENWLSNFAFRIPLGWPVFVISPLILVMISLLTIGVQSAKAALTNPVKTLRSE